VLQYQEDTGKKDQGRAFLDRGSALPKLDEDDLTVMIMATPVADKDNRNCKNPE
jgi:hypothetical protein